MDATRARQPGLSCGQWLGCLALMCPLVLPCLSPGNPRDGPVGGGGQEAACSKAAVPVLGRNWN